MCGGGVCVGGGCRGVCKCGCLYIYRLPLEAHWRFSLICLPFVHDANGSLSFVRLLNGIYEYLFANRLNGLNRFVHLCIIELKNSII